MKVKLTAYNRIEKGEAGDIVEVDPVRARFLFETGLAEPVVIREQIEAPEKKTTVKKTVRAKK